MPISCFIKESSENSASSNWVKQTLEGSQFLYCDSIEGYTIDQSKGVIMLMDRAKVDYSEISKLSPDEIIIEIKSHDGCPGAIQRKINLANIFGISFRYLLYSESCTHHVWIFLFGKDGSGILEREFNSFREFGLWLDGQRSLSISKKYGHEGVEFETSQFEDLPQFDQTLRRFKTPWLANLDAFISDKNGHPLALVEFQYTKKSPRFHCNNFFFLLGEDITRFETLEVARVHSQLPLFIFVWSDNDSCYCIKKVACCTIPHFSSDKHIEASERKMLSSYSRSNKNTVLYNEICASMHSYSFVQNEGSIIKQEHSPTLSINNKTFPHIYYSFKTLYQDKDSFIKNFVPFLQICPYCGKKLIKRHGKFGDFLGCSSYPSCSFTSSVIQ